MGGPAGRPQGPARRHAHGPAPRERIRRSPDPVLVVSILAIAVLFSVEAATPRELSVGTLAALPVLAAAFLRPGRTAVAVLALSAVARLVDSALDGISMATALIDVAGYAALAAVAALVARGMPGTTAAALESPPPPGQPLGQPAIACAAGLTAREREVVVLAAQGYTAREISERLHISERTVETHLANAYPKIGVRSKHELVRAALAARV